MDPSRSDASASVARFFAIAFLFTFGLQGPLALATHGGGEPPPGGLVLLAMVGIFGPTVAAIVVTRAEGGSAGVRALFGSLSPRGLRLGDALVALLLPAALLSGMLLFFRAAGREGPVFYAPDAGRLVVGAIVAVAEELGWRGVAQPRLERRYGPFGAAGIVGVLWALWHVPMLVAAGVLLVWMPVMLLYFVGGSLTFGAILRRTGSLFAVVLAHFGAHLDNSHLPLPGDGLPLVVHAIAFAALGLALTPLPRALRARRLPSCAG